MMRLATALTLTFIGAMPAFAADRALHSHARATDAYAQRTTDWNARYEDSWDDSDGAYGAYEYEPSDDGAYSAYGRVDGAPYAYSSGRKMGVDPDPNVRRQIERSSRSHGD